MTKIADRLVSKLFTSEIGIARELGGIPISLVRRLMRKNNINFVAGLDTAGKLVRLYNSQLVSKFIQFYKAHHRKYREDYYTHKELLDLTGLTEHKVKRWVAKHGIHPDRVKLVRSCDLRITTMLMYPKKRVDLALVVQPTKQQHEK